MSEPSTEPGDRPHLQLSIPPNTTSFKRSFEQFGFDLDESPIHNSNPSHTSTVSEDGRRDNNRHKRARSTSSDTTSSGSSGSGSSSNSSARTALSASSSASSDHLRVSTSTLPRPFLEAPPRLPTPDIDVDMPDVSTTPPPMEFPEAYRLTLSRFHSDPPVLPPLDSVPPRLEIDIPLTIEPDTSPSPTMPPILLDSPTLSDHVLPSPSLRELRQWIDPESSRDSSAEMLENSAGPLQVPEPGLESIEWNDLFNPSGPSSALPVLASASSVVDQDRESGWTVTGSHQVSRTTFSLASVVNQRRATDNSTAARGGRATSTDDRNAPSQSSATGSRHQGPRSSLASQGRTNAPHFVAIGTRTHAEISSDESDVDQDPAQDRQRQPIMASRASHAAYAPSTPSYSSELSTSIHPHSAQSQNGQDIGTPAGPDGPTSSSSASMIPPAPLAISIPDSWNDGLIPFPLPALSMGNGSSSLRTQTSAARARSSHNPTPRDAPSIPASDLPSFNFSISPFSSTSTFEDIPVYHPPVSHEIPAAASPPRLPDTLPSSTADLSGSWGFDTATSSPSSIGPTTGPSLQEHHRQTSSLNNPLMSRVDLNDEPSPLSYRQPRPEQRTINPARLTMSQDGPVAGRFTNTSNPAAHAHVHTPPYIPSQQHPPEERQLSAFELTQQFTASRRAALESTMAAHHAARINAARQQEAERQRDRDREFMERARAMVDYRQRMGFGAQPPPDRPSEQASYRRCTCPVPHTHGRPSDARGQHGRFSTTTQNANAAGARPQSTFIHHPIPPPNLGLSFTREEAREPFHSSARPTAPASRWGGDSGGRERQHGQDNNVDEVGDYFGLPNPSRRPPSPPLRSLGTTPPPTLAHRGLRIPAPDFSIESEDWFWGDWERIYFPETQQSSSVEDMSARSTGGTTHRDTAPMDSRNGEEIHPNLEWARRVVERFGTGRPEAQTRVEPRQNGAMDVDGDLAAERPSVFERPMPHHGQASLTPIEMGRSGSQMAHSHTYGPPAENDRDRGADIANQFTGNPYRNTMRAMMGAQRVETERQLLSEHTRAVQRTELERQILPERARAAQLAPVPRPAGPPPAPLPTALPIYPLAREMHGSDVNPSVNPLRRPRTSSLSQYITNQVPVSPNPHATNRGIYEGPSSSSQRHSINDTAAQRRMQIHLQHARDFAAAQEGWRRGPAGSGAAHPAASMARFSRMPGTADPSMPFNQAIESLRERAPGVAIIPGAAPNRRVDNATGSRRRRYVSLTGRGPRRFALADYMRDEEFDSSYENLMRLSEVMGDANPKKTSSAILESLEKAEYKDWATADSDERCPICLDDYSPTDPVMKLNNCSHWLHRDCLQQWLGTAGTCPVCRKSVAQAAGSPAARRTSPIAIPVRRRPPNSIRLSQNVIQMESDSSDGESSASDREYPPAYVGPSRFNHVAGGRRVAVPVSRMQALPRNPSSSTSRRGPNDHADPSPSQQVRRRDDTDEGGGSGPGRIDPASLPPSTGAFFSYF